MGVQDLPHPFPDTSARIPGMGWTGRGPLLPFWLFLPVAEAMEAGRDQTHVGSA